LNKLNMNKYINKKILYIKWSNFFLVSLFFINIFFNLNKIDEIISSILYIGIFFILGSPIMFIWCLFMFKKKETLAVLTNLKNIKDANMDKDLIVYLYLDITVILTCIIFLIFFDITYFTRLNFFLILFYFFRLIDTIRIKNIISKEEDEK